ncbi:MAG: DUF427 domain-containing protein [Polyangiales bacterium]
MGNKDIPAWAAASRRSWTNRGTKRPDFAEQPSEAQESVWDYPRPPALVPDARRVRVLLHDHVVADTRSSLRLLETSHAPTFYLPRDDVDMLCLERLSRLGSRCEWKGAATYFDVVGGDKREGGAAWSYESPFDDFADLAGHIAFYASRLECFVDGERARPQPGGFYGGWVTSELAGPFKGEPGTGGW